MNTVRGRPGALLVSGSRSLVWLGVANVLAIIVLATLCRRFHVAVVLLRGTREWCDRSALALAQYPRGVLASPGVEESQSPKRGGRTT
jgi:hypothetical protein